jgi:hypothetical protein
VHSFRTLDPATPVQTVVIPAADWGSNDVRNANTQFCTNVLRPAGPSFNAGLHWNYSAIDANVKLADATLRLFFTDVLAGTFNSTQPTLWMAQNEWSACLMRAPGPPYTEGTGLLANAVPATTVENDFTSPRLAAFLEAQLRRRTLVYGTLVRTLGNTNFQSPSATDATKRPSIVVHYYLLPPVAAR